MSEEFDMNEYRKYIIRERALRLKERIERMRNYENPYEDFYSQPRR